MSDVHYTRFTVDEEQAQTARRLDKLLSLVCPQHSRVVIQRHIISGYVQVDDVVCQRPSQAISSGQSIATDFSHIPLIEDSCEAEEIKLDIISEDEQLIIINKPPGMVTHPGHGNRTGTMQSALLYHAPELATLPRAGIVHRLDKETSGLLVVAKTPMARESLIEQFKTRDIGRTYLALTHGTPPPTGVIDLPIGRHRRQPTKMAIRTDGKHSVTRYVVEKRWRNYALLRCMLETGRTHQIRLHLSHSGYPVVGDSVYRRSGQTFPCRQALHATTLKLCHPTTHRHTTWNAPLPDDIQALIRQLDENQAET